MRLFPFLEDAPQEVPLGDDRKSGAIRNNLFLPRSLLKTCFIIVSVFYQRNYGLISSLLVWLAVHIMIRK